MKYAVYMDQHNLINRGNIVFATELSPMSHCDCFDFVGARQQILFICNKLRA